MTIFYAQYHAEPLPGSEQFEVSGGAYVSCWVKAKNVNEASLLISTTIKEAGWKVVGVEDECQQVDELWYAQDSKGKEHFAQAVSDGECYVFDQWPIEPQEGDNVN